MKSSSHFYTVNEKGEGVAFYETSYKDPSKGMRPVTLADARKCNALPSVTTITRVLAAPALIEWLRREVALAIVSTPRNDDESLDDFVERCLAVDAESVADAAKQLGTDIHDLLEIALGRDMSVPGSHPLSAHVRPAITACGESGRVVATEKIVIGEGYGGRVDCITESDRIVTVWDFKTTRSKQLPKKSWPEHRLQLASYAKTLGNTGNKLITTKNIYISTLNPGEFSICENPDWLDDYSTFLKVRDIWCWQNNYYPLQPKTT